jgi:3-hydroxyacyl-[acyl-carrier-protein] dehydratase
MIQVTEKYCIDVNGIMRRIPHRSPFLLIDGVVSCTPGKSIVAVKNVAIEEPYFPGHFPGHPVMPGVLIVEVMAQAAGVLVWETLANADKNFTLYLVSIEKSRFKQLVCPGDRLVVTVKLISHRLNFWSFDALAQVDSRDVAHSRFRVLANTEISKTSGKTHDS